MSKITSVKKSADAVYVVVSAGKKSFSYKEAVETADMRKAAVVGGDYEAALAMAGKLPSQPKGSAKLANGLTARNAPNCAKSVADAAAKVRVAEKPAKAARAKAPAKEKTAAKTGAAMPLTVNIKKIGDAGLTAGSGREAKLAFVIATKPKTTADVLDKDIGDGTILRMDALQGMKRRGHVTF